jgi:putative aminopeptidase FrvX
MMHPGQRAAVALAYNLSGRRFEIAAHGDIITEADGSIFFQAHDDVLLHAGQRACFYSKMSWDRETGELRGSLDDIGAAVALVLAAGFLADYDIELMLGLTDEEEGISGSSNQTICRGGARLLRYFDQPELVIASDVHEAVTMIEGDGPIALKPGDGACFVEKDSRGRGAVTPPHLYELERQLADELATEGIHLRENIGGYVSRTEGVNAILRTPNVAIVGFLGRNRHFEKEVTTANIQDLVNLARAVVCLVLLTRTSIWREVMHYDH